MKEQLYFKPGDIVKIAALANSPLMRVKDLVRDDENVFLGVMCFWFTVNKEYRERLFSSKDLELVEE